MEAKVGDRVAIQAKKVGQPPRVGVVASVTKGLSGVRYQVRWEAGETSVISPGPGTLTVVGRTNGKKPAAKAKKATTKKKSGKKK